MNTRFLRLVAESAGDEDDARVIFSAAAELDRLAAENEALQAELERYSMSAGAADQFRREALAMRQALGFDKYGDDIAPVDLLNALAQRDAEVIERAINECAYKTLEGDIINVECIRNYANQLRRQAKA